MPPPKTVLALEKLREKGLEVTYAPAPWYTDNVEKLAAEKEQREQRIATAQHAEHLEKLPADRSEGVGMEIPRVQRGQLYETVKYGKE